MVAVSSDEYIAAGRDGNVLGLISCPLQNPSNFYEYQWRKHGSCTGMRKDRYFQTVMDLYFRYDLATAFQDAGICLHQLYYHYVH